MSLLREWLWEFFVEKGELFGAVLRAERRRGEEEARLIARLLEAHGIPRGSRVIELGCGNGRVAVPLAREGFRVTCLDISPLYVREALEYARELGVEDRFEAIVGDAWRVDELASKGYDAALMVWTTLIGYKGDPESDVELLSRIRRIVSKQGKLLILKQAHRDLVVSRNARCVSNTLISDLGEIIVIERPSFNPLTSIIENTWSYYRRRGNNLEFMGKASFRLRVYTVTELVEMARKAGWELEALYGSLDQAPFTPWESGINAIFRAKTVYGSNQ